MLGRGRAAKAALVAFGLLAGACSGYRIERDGRGVGYDVYEPEPYLLGKPQMVDAGGTGRALVVSYEIVWLPNYGKRYRVHSWAGLGKADFTFTFENGWKLTSLTNRSDNSEVLSQIVEFAQHLLPPNPFGIDATQRKAGEPLVAAPTPILYKIEFDANGSVACLRPVGIGPDTCPCPVAATPLSPAPPAPPSLR